MEAFGRFKKKHLPDFLRFLLGIRLCAKVRNAMMLVVTGVINFGSSAGLPTNYYNLMFVPDSVRKISYASSFGVSQIPWYQVKRTAEYLNRLDFISMRENRGSQIVKELTGKEVPTILDPVFSFDMAGWEKLVPAKKNMSEPYIFAYFLGANPAYRKAVEELSRKTGLKIVALRHRISTWKRTKNSEILLLTM